MTLNRYNGGRAALFLTLLMMFGPGALRAQDALRISKSSDFSTHDRLFQVDETLYLQVTTEGFNVEAAKESAFRLAPHGAGETLAGVLHNELDGTFTAAVDLSRLTGTARMWSLGVWIEDEEGHVFTSRAEIVVQGLARAPEGVLVRGTLERATATEITVGGVVLRVTPETPVLAMGGRPSQLSGLIGAEVSVRALRAPDGVLTALLITVTGGEAAEIELRGRLAAVTENAVTVRDFSLRIDEHTEIAAENGAVLIASDLEAGAVVLVRARRLGEAWVTTKIRLLAPREAERTGFEHLIVEGTVSETGEGFLLVAGVRLHVNAETRFEGIDEFADVRPGMDVRALIARGPSNRLIILALRAGENEEKTEGKRVEVEGTIEAVEDHQITVGGIRFALEPWTHIVGPRNESEPAGRLVTGLEVGVRGLRREDGTAVALVVNVERPAEAFVEVEGSIDEKLENALRVGETIFRVTEETVLRGEHRAVLTFEDLRAGLFVEARLEAAADGTLTALGLKIETPFEAEDVETVGHVEAWAPDHLVVGGLAFAVEPETVVLDEEKNEVAYAALSVGLVVRVKAEKTADGTLRAVEIRLMRGVHAEGRIEGAVNAVAEGSIEVAGVAFRIGARTILAGGETPQIGQWARVHFNVLGDGSRFARRIQIVSQTDGRALFQGVVNAVDAASVVVSGFSLALGPGTAVIGPDGTAATREELKTGQTVGVLVAFADGRAEAVRIQIRTTARMTGRVDVAHDGTIEVAGRPVRITDRTLVIGPDNAPLSREALRQGAFVEVLAVTEVSPSGGKTAGAVLTADRVLVQQSVTSTSVREEAAAPDQFELGRNYPNPFNPTTRIPFTLNRDAFVTLKVYNALGQEVRTLVAGTLAAGAYHMSWDGADQAGRAVSSGVYLYRLETATQVQTRSMLMVK